MKLSTGTTSIKKRKVTSNRWVTVRTRRNKEIALKSRSVEKSSTDGSDERDESFHRPGLRSQRCLRAPSGGKHCFGVVFETSPPAR